MKKHLLLLLIIVLFVAPRELMAKAASFDEIVLEQEEPDIIVSDYSSEESNDFEELLEDQDHLLAAKTGIALESLSITGNPVAVVGKNTTYKAALSPANATSKSVEWSISPEGKGVTISSGGLLKVSADCKLTECIVTVTSKADVSISASKVVGINPAYIQSINIESDGRTINGKTIPLFITPENSYAPMYIDTEPVITLRGRPRKSRLL